MNRLLKIALTLLLFVICLNVSAQQIDTIKIQSTAFNKERIVYIHTPYKQKYISDKVKLPVIFVLDGQHEWFADPVVQNIKALQYTHQVPHALIVVIPHQNRYTECAIKDINTVSPLEQFITKEVAEAIEKYNVGKDRLIIGHSFSSSFAFKAFLKNRNFFTGVFMHTPLDKMEELLPLAQQQKDLNKKNVFYSVGGIADHLDTFHRKAFDGFKLKYANFMEGIHTLAIDEARHNTVPIVANPAFLLNYYARMSDRFVDIARVDENYSIVTAPESVEVEMRKISKASLYNGEMQIPEIAEFNGIASRYWHNKHYDHGIAVYNMALEYYSKLGEFHLSLYELHTEKKDNAKAIEHLKKARALIVQYEEANEQMLKEIDVVLNKG